MALSMTKTASRRISSFGGLDEASIAALREKVEEEEEEDLEKFPDLIRDE